MVQTAITSALIIALSIGARAAGVSHAVMEPFQLGLNVYGTNCLLLAGLIMSGRYYNAVSMLACMCHKSSSDAMRMLTVILH